MGHHSNTQIKAEDRQFDAGVEFDIGCERFVELETRIWRETFKDLGVNFNTEEFLREAGASIDHIIRTAIFYGAGLSIEQARELRIGAAHSLSHIRERLALLRQHGTFEEGQRLTVVE